MRSERLEKGFPKMYKEDVVMLKKALVCIYEATVKSNGASLDQESQNALLALGCGNLSE